MSRRRVVLVAALAFLGQAALVAAAVARVERRSAEAGAPAPLAARRALDFGLVALGPWTSFAAIALGALAGDRRLLAPPALGLAAVAGAVAALWFLAGRWGQSFDAGRATLFYACLSLAACGVFLAARAAVGVEGALAASLAVLALSVGSLFLANGWIEAVEGTDRASRIEWVLAVNPMIAATGALTEVDLLRTDRFYAASVIGPFYPYRYPSLGSSCRAYLAVAAAGFAVGVAGLALRRRDS